MGEVVKSRRSSQLLGSWKAEQQQGNKKLKDKVKRTKRAVRRRVLYICSLPRPVNRLVDIMERKTSARYTWIAAHICLCKF